MIVRSRTDLYKIVNLNLPGSEIGVAEGLFSLTILKWGIKKLYMVDIWNYVEGISGMAGDPTVSHDQNYLEAKERVKHYNAELIKGLSIDVAKTIEDNSLGFIYIDACHDYDHVLEDLQSWVPKLVKGGVCGIHDYANPDYDVKRAVSDFTKNRFTVHQIKEDGKTENIGAYFINK